MNSQLFWTVFVAFVGFAAKYLNDLKIAQRKDKLDRVNRQLKELYGPLLSLTASSNSVWIEFRSKYRPNVSSYFGDEMPPTDFEKMIWRNWMQTIFIPINEQIYNIILENGDLIIENDFPQPFKDLCAHVASYRPVVEKWTQNDFSEHLALLNYPVELKKYVEKGYQELKAEQQWLLKSKLLQMNLR